MASSAAFFSFETFGSASAFLVTFALAGFVLVAGFVSFESALESIFASPFVPLTTSAEIILSVASVFDFTTFFVVIAVFLGAATFLEATDFAVTLDSLLGDVTALAETIGSFLAVADFLAVVFFPGTFR